MLIPVLDAALHMFDSGFSGGGWSVAAGPCAGAQPRFWLAYSCNRGAQCAVPGILLATSPAALG